MRYIHWVIEGWRVGKRGVVWNKTPSSSSLPLSSPTSKVCNHCSWAHSHAKLYRVTTACVDLVRVYKVLQHLMLYFIGVQSRPCEGLDCLWWLNVSEHNCLQYAEIPADKFYLTFIRVLRVQSLATIDASSQEQNLHLWSLPKVRYHWCQVSWCITH